jgi:hypothetical protein
VVASVGSVETFTAVDGPFSVRSELLLFVFVVPLVLQFEAAAAPAVSAPWP